MLRQQSLANHFLVAMPTLNDPNFEHAVVYVCEHNEQGAVGLIINRPMQFSLKFVFEQLKIEPKFEDKGSMPLLYGGPVEPERGFVIHPPTSKWRSSLALSEDVTVTTSSDIIRAIGDDLGPKEMIITLGYSGWDSGQLDQEVLANAWLICPYNKEILYEVPYDERWEYAGRSIGVKMSQLFLGYGHA